MAAKEEDSLSLDGSITFDKTEDQDSPPVTARSFMYNARTPISLTRTVLDSARRRDAADNKKTEKCDRKNWRLHDACGENTVYMTPNGSPDKLYVARVIKTKDLSTDQREALHEMLRTYEDDLTGDYMLNIVELAINSKKNKIYVIFENCEGGTLHALITRAKQYDEQLNEIEIQDWLVQILIALKHLHDQEIKHLNITCNSLLLKNNTIRLTEPNELRWLYNNPARADALETTAGAVRIDTEEKLVYTAPEVLLNQNISNKSDIWSVGCVLYEMCARKRLFKAKTPEDCHEKIIQGKLPRWPKGCPQHLETIWKSMMQMDVESRPSAHELLQHPVLREHLQDMNLSAVTPFPDDTAAKVSSATSRQSDPDSAKSLQSGMPQVFSVEYELNSDDEDLNLTEEDTMKLLSLNIS